MTTTTELHAAITQMQALMKQAAEVIEHNASSLGEVHTRNGIIEDREVQAAVESDADLVAHLRAAALPWDQRQKLSEQPAQQEQVADKHQAFIDSLPSDMEDKMFMQIDYWARQSYARHLRSTGGQMITAADSSENHIIWAALRWAKENSFTPQAQPAQRKPLTDEQIDEMSRTMVKGNKSVNWLCRSIEAYHGIKEDA